VNKTFRTLAALLLALSLLAAACGSDDSEESSDDSAVSSDTTAAAGACDELPLKTEGTLTVATGEPAFPPWVSGVDAEGNDDPTLGEGFESALVYALAGNA